MRRNIKLPSEEIAKIDFTQSWQVTPFLSATLNETGIEDVVFSEDGKTGTISYDTIEQETSHTYSYISAETGNVESYTIEAGVHGRPLFFDAETMEEITQDEVDAIINEYDDYQLNHAYLVNDKLKYNGKVYIVVQAHTSQEDWKPDIVKSLYREIIPEQLIGEWVQPQGAHDAYMTGDKVSYNGSIWESTIDNNVWAPGVYGWVKI